MKPKSISMKEISRLANVSIATVSRVINQNGRYSQKTEQKVLDVIEEYGYTPSLVAKSLRTNKTQNIGIIVPDITNEFFAKIVLEVQNLLFRRSYASFICNTNERLDLETRYLSLLHAQNICGLIYICGLEKEESVPGLDLPTIYIDRRPFSPLNEAFRRRDSGVFDPHTAQHASCPTATASQPVSQSASRPNKNLIVIESDNVAGGYMATQELIAQGAKRIAILVYPGQTSSYERRLTGYKQALTEAGIPIDQNLIVVTDSTDFDGGHKAALQLMDAEIPFDGLFATNDFLALGAQVALLSREIDIPKQVKLIGFDDISLSRYCAKPISTIHQQVDIIGKTAVDVLMQLIEGKSVRKREYIIPVELIQRETT